MREIVSDDHDALLAEATYIDIESAIHIHMGHDGQSDELNDWVTDLMIAITPFIERELRDLQADYLAALDVIARLTLGWNIVDNEFPERHTWYLEPGIDDGPETDDLGNQPMSDREWRVFCHAAQRATRNHT